MMGPSHPNVSRSVMYIKNIVTEQLLILQGENQQGTPIGLGAPIGGETAFGTSLFFILHAGYCWPLGKHIGKET